MSKGVNMVVLVGNLGADPEVRYGQSGNAMATLSLATSESWTDKQSGQQQERTEWHRLVVYTRLAEIAEKYLKKGSKIYVRGSLRTRKWQDQSGQDRYTTEIIVQDLQMLDRRDGDGMSAPYDQPSRQNAHASAPADDQTNDDDIPF